MRGTRVIAGLESLQGFTRSLGLVNCRSFLYLCFKKEESDMYVQLLFSAVNSSLGQLLSCAAPLRFRGNSIRDHEKFLPARKAAGCIVEQKCHTSRTVFRGGGPER